ncbi:MAG: hypothetical protein IKN41_08180 [Candidatus Methanomethylophilaceae archaeon]|nr:hypothetical protein [Candidatus Methanomethylophilaceae archaeon]
MYLTCTDEKGNKYTDIEKQSYIGSIGAATRQAYRERRERKKSKKAQKTE